MSDNRLTASLFSRWGVLFGVFFIMLIGVSLLAGLIGRINLDPRTSGLIIAAMQSILLFIIPSVVYARVFSHSPWRELDLIRGLEWRQILGVLLLFTLGLPALNQMIFWNEGLQLPASMQGIEDTLRQWEDQAQDASNILLATSSFGGMLCGVIVIGVLTGFAEELFFRGAIQKSMEASGINPYVAIWSAAFIFSALHFQFYGFIPRLLLGAFFGYLLFWSRSLWVSAFAHALNNSVVVVTAWLTRKDLTSTDVEEWGISSGGFPWIALVSMVLFLLLARYGSRLLFYSSLSKIKPLKRNLR